LLPIIFNFPFSIINFFERLFGGKVTAHAMHAATRRRRSRADV
jgi:hypothetical protein